MYPRRARSGRPAPWARSTPALRRSLLRRGRRAQGRVSLLASAGANWLVSAVPPPGRALTPKNLAVWRLPLLVALVTIASACIRYRECGQFFFRDVV
jgi:hypothetical protein